MNMMKLDPKKRNTLIVVLAVVIIISLYFIFDATSKKENKSPNEDMIIATTTLETNTGGVIELENNGQATIEQVPITDQKGSLPAGMPNLSREIRFASNTNFEPEVVTLVTKKILDLQATLKTDPLNFPAWIDLGLYYKMIGDIQGAMDIWIYATKLSPTNFVAFGNLGNLYAYYLKDMGMADVYYRQAISKDPSQVYLYIQLAGAYKDVSNDIAKAVAVVDQGLVANPNDSALLNLRENLLK